MVMRQIRLTYFHILEFLKVPFFPSLMIISTFTAITIQALAIYAWGGDHWIAWVRSGIIGMWTTTTVSAGMIGFERFKGTLVYLVTARISPFASLSAVVSAAATFGLFSFLVAWIGWGTIWISSSQRWGTAPIDIYMFGIAMLQLWIACLAISFVIACVFVLSPNAIVYEELLLVPVLIFSGLVFTNGEAPLLIRIIGTLIPISAPSQLLLGQVQSDFVVLKLIEGIFVSTVWLFIARFLGKHALQKARETGTLEVI